MLRSAPGGATLGGFSGTPESEGAGSAHLSRKIALLRAEGVTFDSRLRVVNPGTVLLPHDSPFPQSVLARVRALLEGGKGSRNGSGGGIGRGTGAVAVLCAPLHVALSPPPPCDVRLRARLGRAGTPGLAVRTACRSGALQGHTKSLAPGVAQANLVLLPARHAAAFRAYCAANPQACPLLETSPAPGDATLPRTCPSGVDVARDAPRYIVWRDGVAAEERDDVAAEWAARAAGPPEERLVAFALGCSFSFEAALTAAGCAPVPPPHGANVPMYETARETAPVPPFSGPLVVSLRVFPSAAAAVRASDVTAAFPAVHGAPVHIGAAAALGVHDVRSPDYGDPPALLRAGDVCVWHACGVTPQAALKRARLPFAITHAPGCMLVLDVANDALRGWAAGGGGGVGGGGGGEPRSSPSPEKSRKRARGSGAGA